MKPRTLAPSARTPVNSINSQPRPGIARRSPRQQIRVLLADDHPVVRHGIVSCLKPHPHLQVVGEAADGQEVLLKARELLPDVLLTDVYMPRLTGLAITQTLHSELPQIKVLLFSLELNSDFVLRCARIGAKGFILKQAPPEEFVQAIETVYAGQPFFSPDVARVALNQMVCRNGQGPDPSDLTNREREVLIWIAEGLCNKEIGCRLNIGTRTVETHRERLMRKLGIHSIAGLTRFAVARGLIPTPELAAACP